MPQVTTCSYARKMATKSEVLRMPVLMKDEKKYSECVDVLDQLEKWTKKFILMQDFVYQSDQNDDATTPTISGSSQPDQPASHVPPRPSDNDPLKDIKIPCYGDQLTRVRFAGAKDLHAGCHAPEQRFNHIYPFCIVNWHKKKKIC